MQSAETFLKHRSLIRQLLIGIILNNGGRKHLPQGYGHPFRDASQVAKDTKDRHAASIIRKPQRTQRNTAKQEVPHSYSAAGEKAASSTEFGMTLLSCKFAPDNTSAFPEVQVYLRHQF